MTSNDPKSNKSSISLSYELQKEIEYLRDQGMNDIEIQKKLEVLRVGKNSGRQTIVKELSFSWLNIDDFLGALEKVTKLDSPEEKVQMIKRIFINQLGEEMTVGEIVKALENEQKKKKANSADGERLESLKELLFIYFRHAYDPHPIFLWRAYTLCRQIQLPIPPELLRYLDGVAGRIEEIIDQKIKINRPFKYAITGEIPKRGKSDPQQGAINFLRR